jgi:ribosomal protein S20
MSGNGALDPQGIQSRLEVLEQRRARDLAESTALRAEIREVRDMVSEGHKTRTDILRRLLAADGKIDRLERKFDKFINAFTERNGAPT